MQLPDTLSVRARPVPDAGVLVRTDSHSGIVQKDQLACVGVVGGGSAQECLPERFAKISNVSLSIKIAQKPYIMGSLGPKALKYESFDAKGFIWPQRICEASFRKALSYEFLEPFRNTYLFKLPIGSVVVPFCGSYLGS